MNLPKLPFPAINPKDKYAIADWFNDQIFRHEHNSKEAVYRQDYTRAGLEMQAANFIRSLKKEMFVNHLALPLEVPPETLPKKKTKRKAK